MGMGGKLLVDGALVAGFGLQHSLLATLAVKRKVKGRSGIDPLAWRSVESLVNVSYILAAAALWQPTHEVVWRVSGPAAAVMYALAVGSWLWYWQLHLFEYDCGLAFGSTTLVAKLAGALPPKLVPWKIGSRRWIRFPVHTAFFGMFLLIPTMSADLLVLAIVLNVYNVVGSVLYDKRLVRLAGDAYREYVAVTGLIWPPVYRAPSGAVDLAMPAPRHWRRPSMHLPGLVAGAGLAGIYALLLGRAVLRPATMGLAALAGLLGALAVGAVLGRLLRPQADDWPQQQTDLSTTVALAGASGVALWAAAEWAATGHLPVFATFLPLWFTVQYLGHLFAFLAAREKWSASLRLEPVAAVRAVAEPQPAVAGGDMSLVPR